MEKKVYVLIYHDNLNAYSAVYATKKVAEQALQQEREILLNDYSGWKITNDDKDRFVMASFEFGCAEYVSLHIEEQNIV